VLNLGTVSGIAFFLLYYFVREKDRAYRMLNQERDRADQLLLNVLPKEVASRLRLSGQTIAEHFDSPASSLPISSGPLRCLRRHGAGRDRRLAQRGVLRL
jgi:hypothetical protein